MSEVTGSLANLEDDDLLGAFTHDASEDNIAIMADDVPNENGSGIDYKLSYFEGQVDKTYKIKFITNPFGLNVTHRNIYKKLPDPTRKGKTFQYVSSNSPKTCPVLELFFEQHKLKKEGDVLATHKIKKFLTVTRQAVALVQILSSDDATEIGKIRMMTFSTGDKNAPIAELLNEKMNPTDQMLKDGFIKEDVFNIFGSSIMMLQVTEADYDGQKGRDFSKSKWLPAPVTDSVTVKYPAEDGTEIVYKFKKDDVTADGKQFTNDQAKIAFKHLISQLKVEALDVHNMFAYKVVGDERNTESTNKYLNDVMEKVNKIVPVIANAKSMSEIATFTGETAEGGKPNTFADNAPTELANSVMNQEQQQTETNIVQPTQEMTSEVADILKS